MNPEPSDNTRASGQQGKITDSKPASLLLLPFLIFSPTLCLFGTLALASLSGFLLSDAESSSILISGLFLAGLVLCIAPIVSSYTLARGLKSDTPLRPFIGVLIWFGILLTNAFISFATCTALTGF
jgi:hypothetical protein